MLWSFNSSIYLIARTSLRESRRARVAFSNLWRRIYRQSDGNKMWLLEVFPLRFQIPLS